MSLFQLGDFVLHSGQRSRWKIDCNAPGPQDWKTLAAMAAEFLPPFGAVEGIPGGGLKLASAMSWYRKCTCGRSAPEHWWTKKDEDPPGNCLRSKKLVDVAGLCGCKRFSPIPPVLICDDVLTTGVSMEEQRAGREVIGLVIFARAETPKWIRVLFTFNPDA